VRFLAEQSVIELLGPAEVVRPDHDVTEHSSLP
jgi:hypothetical protein